jgi:hypothetical protein
MTRGGLVAASPLRFVDIDAFSGAHPVQKWYPV